MNERSFIDKVAASSGQDPGVVSLVIEEFCLGLRRELDEYKGMNGDYIGEQLHWDIGNRAFFHLLVLRSGLAKSVNSVSSARKYFEHGPVRYAA